ncbi:serine hydrolase domain-containing protein [Chitinophaga flava]|uniref:Penicillin-binding protein n=1 Tax=Chitinophaga flava TaxID=2259036 RepID=A0A365Y090_9BACT|nr:serine hydrolase [Chitinophaga flava]RBL92013.1 penicillin-binding protein [Chitinophaga flava]
MRTIIPILLAVICFSCHKTNEDPLPETPDQETGTFEEANIDKEKILKLENEINSGKYNIHSLIILRKNKLIYEHYFAGEDAVFPNPVGKVPHTRDSLHDCRSVTKSIVSACVGIALKQGKIKSIDDKIFDYFPGYKQYATGDKADITIRHLLTMSSGLDWNERISYADPANSERQMLEAQDPTGFVLQCKSAAKPGTVFNYSGGNTHLLGQIVERSTGMTIREFASRYLFQPLGIEKFFWTTRADGITWMPSGLRMRPIDMAKVGRLYMQQGQWEGQQLLPASWIAQSTRWIVNSSEDGVGYGFQFWCSRPQIAGQQVDMAQAAGNGGQIISMIPSLDLEVVMTAGYYNDETDIIGKVLVEEVLSAVKK